MHHYPTGAFKAHPLMLAMAMLLPSFVYAETNENAQLPTITVKAADENQEKKAYTVKKTTTAVPLGLSVKETPQSVSVVTEQRMKDQGLTSLIDVADNVTGINAQRFETNRGSLTARGFDIDNYQIDGVPTTYDVTWSSGEIFTSTALFDHIDVVRGATGLTTGPGNPSAAINMVRKRATSKDVTANLEVSAGTWNTYRTMGDIAGGLNQSGSVRGRAVMEYEQGDSWADLLQKQTLTLLLAGEADLTDRTVLSTGVSYQQNDPKGAMWGGLPLVYADGKLTDWNRSKTTSADWVRWESDYTNIFADLTHTFANDWKLTLSYANGNRDGDSKLLYLSGYPDRNTGKGLSASGGSYVTSTDQDNASLTLDGNFNLLGRKHDFAIGYQYSNQDFLSQSRNADYQCGALYCSVPVDNFNQWSGNFSQPTWGALSFYEKSKTEQNALYAVTRLSVIDPLKVILGGRLTNYHKTGNGVWTPAYDIQHDHEFTPYAGVLYDINQQVSAYASYTSIFQPQSEKDVNGKILDPIEGNSIEIGLKSAWFDGRLNGTLSLFNIKQDNLAQEAGKNPATNEAYYRAADGAKSKGFEFELSGEVLPNWNVTAGYSQFKATDANDQDINSTLPRKLIQAYTTYKLAGAFENLTVGGGVNWQDKTSVDATDPTTISVSNPYGSSKTYGLDSYALVNLMARYQLTKDFSAQVNINNVFDEKYYNVFPAYGQLTYGAPRNATLTLRYQF